MSGKIKPRYPIYIPSKGRADQCKTARFLVADEVPFKLVVEAQEADLYAAEFGGENLLVLPFSERGSVIPARNWIKEHATGAGFERHWQLDDNIERTYRWYKGVKIPCSSGVALSVCEDFADRYENVAIAGLEYFMFGTGKQPPFTLNTRIYSCSLILNSLPYKWRGKYNEDADLCLQVLAGGWCTVLINAFLVLKTPTMIMKGGNTDELYKGDGRLKMARSLERMWPGVVTTKRRFRRPQHVVKNAWRRFDTPLILKDGVDLQQIEPNEYGLKIKRVKPIKGKAIKKLYRKRKQQEKANG